MKIEEFDGAEERRVLISHLTDPLVCGMIAARWRDGGLYQYRYANMLGAWACSFHAKYGQPPREHIQRRFESWAAASNRDKSVVEQIESLLRQLSAEYDAAESHNSGYLADQATQHFKKVALTKHVQELNAAIATGDITKAETLASGYGPLELQLSDWIDPLRDHAAIRDAFAESAEPLVKLPGAYGEFLNGAFERSVFMAFEGPMGRGKSVLLMDIVWRALWQRLKVVYFVLGDLSKRQVMRRFHIRAAKHPRYKTQPGRPIRWPISMTVPFGGDPVVSYEDKFFDDDLSWQHAVECSNQVIKHRLKTDEPLLWVSVHQARSISVRGVLEEIRRRIRNGWVPDCVVLDYADILAPVNAREESRDQINTTWIELRAMADELHALVITATQTNAASFDTNTIDMKHFSGNNLKLAHCAFMVGINQSKDEKKAGIMRLNYVKARELEFDQRRCVYLAGNLALMNPSVASCFATAPPDGN